jgi:hypothetical protein
MSEKDNPHEETPIDPNTKVLLNLFQHLGSTSEGGDQETGLTGQNPSLDFTINLENLDITALQNLSTTVDDIPPEQMICSLVCSNTSIRKLKKPILN